jgi:hypothetical protein
MAAGRRAVVLASASTRISASVRPGRRPRSKAVRAGVVSGTPLASCRSSSRNSSRWMRMPAAGFPFRRYSSAGVDPLGAVQRRGRQARNSRLPIGPQPRRDRPVCSRGLAAPRHVDVAVDAVVLALQDSRTHLAAGERFGTDERRIRDCHELTLTKRYDESTVPKPGYPQARVATRAPCRRPRRPISGQPGVTGSWRRDHFRRDGLVGRSSRARTPAVQCSTTRRSAADTPSNTSVRTKSA